jgi:hypothetical protein
MTSKPKADSSMTIGTGFVRELLKSPASIELASDSSLLIPKKF